MCYTHNRGVNMNEYVKNSIDARKQSFYTAYEITDKDIENKIEDLFKKICEFGETCSDAMDFENKFQSSELNNEYINILNGVYDVMTSGGYAQANNREKDLFSILKNANCYCELPFSYKEGNDIWRGNIDLLYELNGKWFIVDYKTNYEQK